MLSGVRLVHLGDLEMTLASAAGIAASLIASRAWRMALLWLLLFLACIGLVGASKIAFMGWGTGWQAIGFKALSGHAAGVTAVFPMLFFLLLHGRNASALPLGVGAGLALGALVALMLVVLHEHSIAEAGAGWAVGALASIAAIRMADRLPALPLLPSALSFALAFAVGMCLMESAHIGYWMIRAARLLSGNQMLYPLSFD
jgi:hypothetical protein